LELRTQHSHCSSSSSIVIPNSRVSVITSCSAACILRATSRPRVSVTISLRSSRPRTESVNSRFSVKVNMAAHARSAVSVKLRLSVMVFSQPGCAVSVNPRVSAFSELIELNTVAAATTLSASTMVVLNTISSVGASASPRASETASIIWCI